MERLHILDGHGYIFRAHYALVTAGRGRQGVRLTTSAGMPTGALLVYAQMLIRLYLDERPERIAVVFDAPGRSFRSDIDGEYKATRRETPEDLQVQLPYFRKLTEALGWPTVAVPDVEADDAIATLSRRARERGWEVVVYSGDKDLMQLVDGGVSVVDSMRQITYDAARVTEKFGVAPEKVGDWLALVGDTSDNVPGMAGVGSKTAAKLLNDHGSIDGILASAGELKGKLKERFADPEQLERLELSRRLVTLVDDVDIGRDVDGFVHQPWDGAHLRGLLRELEFDNLIERLEAAEGALADGGGGEPEDGGPAPQTITAAEALAELAAAARAAGRVAIHAETDGARSDRAELVGLAVAVADRPPAYIPLAHRYLSVPAQLEARDLEPLARVLSDPGVEVVCHDAKETRKVLAAAGVALGRAAFDTMLASYLLDATTDAYGVEVVCRGAGGVQVPERKSLLGKGKSAIGFEAVSVEEATRYSGAVAVGVLRASKALVRRLGTGKLTSLLRDLELPLAGVLAEVETAGIAVDVAHLRALSDRLGRDIGELERQVFETAGDRINIGSPKQLSALLFDRLGLKSERMRKTKTGYSTDADVLESLRGAHPVVPLILEHRELVKLKSTYIDALPPLVNPRTGRLHTSFRQAVAATGRLSSTEPNLQNIPIRTELGREIRRAFVAESGRVIVSADYSQIELRVLAHLSEDPVLVRAFRDGIDVHTQTAAEVFDIPRERVGQAERRVAKAVNYGLVYGQSDFGLARALDIPRAEARHYIERYFERFARVREFMDEVVEAARQTGEAVTILGRKRPIPELSARGHRRSQAERIAQNTPMQGSAADILKLAMLRVSERIRDAGLPARMLLTVHDELVLEAPRERAEEVGAAVRREMAAAFELSVPLVVDIGIGETWADAH